MSDGSPKVKAPSKSTFHFAAGLSSGILSAVLLQPIDLLKTRVQQSGHHSLRLTLRTLRSSPKGLASLYRGTVPSALRTGFGSAIYFSSLNAIRSYSQNIPFLAQNVAPAPPSLDSAGTVAVKGEGRSSNLPRLSPTGNLLTGATARGFAGLILMPLTVIKVRYESSMYGYTSIAHATRDIISREGVRGLFAGVGATALRDAPYAGLYVLFYEESKKVMGSYLALRDQQSQIKGGSEAGGRMGVSRSALVNFSSGAMAATACSIVSNPFDAVKTRIQLQPGVYRNMWHAARRMVGPEEGRGFRALFDGLGLRVSRKAMSSALAWTVYEELIRRAESRVVGGEGKERKDVL